MSDTPAAKRVSEFSARLRRNAPVAAGACATE